MITKGKISIKHIITQVPGNIVSDMDGEKVMLNVGNGKYYNLGEIGGAIWDLLEKEVQVDKLVETLMANYTVEQSECEENVLSFLEVLLDEGLIKLK